MKRFFTFLLIIFCSVPMLFSQVKLTKTTHGFISGMEHQGQTVEYQDPGLSGNSVIWDYSKITIPETIEKSFSDLETNYNEGNIKVARNDGCSFFFNNTEESNEFWGYESKNGKLILTQPIVKTKYPQEYGTQFDGFYSGTLSLDENHSRTIEGTYSTHADATGTIILPGNLKLPVLRVKTTQTDASWELVKYLWYAQNEKLPVFVTMEEYIIGNDGTGKLTSKRSFLNTNVNKSPTGISAIGEVSYKVLQNPFKDEVQLSYTISGEANVNIDLYASNGAKIATLISNQVQSGSLSIAKDVTSVASVPGIYFLKIKIGDKVYTEKLIKK
jgi:hypothetical protein